MSQENVEIVRAIYEAMNRGDWDAAFRDADPDFKLVTQRGPNAGTHRGRPTVQAFLQDYRAAFDTWVVEPEQFLEAGDQVVAIVKPRVRPKGTSTEFAVRNGHIWTIRDGVVVSMHSFPEPEKALEAAGLSEQDAHADS